MKRRCSICGSILEPDSTICSCCGTSIVWDEMDTDLVKDPWKDLEEMELVAPTEPELGYKDLYLTIKKSKNYRMVFLLILTALTVLWIVCSILAGQPRSIGMLIVFVLPILFVMIVQRGDKKVLNAGIIIIAAILLVSVAVEGKEIFRVLQAEMRFQDRTSLSESSGSVQDYIPLEEVLIENPMIGRGINQLGENGLYDISNDAVPMMYYCLYADHTYLSSSGDTGTYNTFGYKDSPDELASDSSYKSAVKAIKNAGYKSRNITILQINTSTWYFAVPDDWQPGEEIYYVERMWSINNSAPVEDIHLVKVRTQELPENI